MMEIIHERSSPEIILALDLEDRQQIKNILQKTGERLNWVKSWSPEFSSRQDTSYS